MINIRNLSVTYNARKVLDNITLDLPKTGLVIISGPSGCGKTTLFNCLSGLIKYQGEIIFDGISLNNIPMTKINNFRLKNIGFIFQDFKLFNLDTVIHNVAFPLNAKVGSLSSRGKRRIADLLRIVNLEDKANQVVKNLSGGEKQRTAIARALINNPKLILADEPTGALDEVNAKNIMEILKTISKEKVVIVVSHDKELVNEYADKVIELKDGKISNIYGKNNIKTQNNLNIIKEEISFRKARLPLLFVLRHTFSSIKERKWRTLLINMITSLGLIGVGLAFSISNTISTNIKEACSSLFSDNQIIMSLKEETNISSFIGADYDELLLIKDSYSDYIENVETIFQTDFNNVFKDEEEFALYTNKTKLDLNNYNFRHINEYKKINKVSSTVYPNEIHNLEDDEVVISLSLGTIYDFCYKLSIIRTVESFIDYMKNNDIYLMIHTLNNDWQYEDEQILKLKGFVLDYEPVIYHSKNRWNEYLIEDTMRFPSTLNLTSNDVMPWTLRKLYYLELKEGVDRDMFLNKVKYDKYMDEYLFEISSHDYMPLTIDEDEEIKNINRIIVFKKTFKDISPRFINKVNEYFPECKSSTLGSYGGYLIHQEAMMMGFSNYTYFSSDKELLISTMEDYSSVPTYSNQSLNLPSDIKVGHYSKSLQNGVIFKEIPTFLASGRHPNNLDEIVVSKKLYDSFSSFKGDILSLAVITSEEMIEEGKVLRNYRVIDLHIVGIVDNDEFAIYHNRDWLIDFYQCRVGISMFMLGINSVCFSLDDNVDKDDVLMRMKRALPDYEVTNPLSEVNEGIDEICHYLELAMIAFSSIATVISIFLLSMCNYLHAFEIKNDIGLARCIGISGLESTKFVFIHSFVMGFVSLLTASFELVISSYFISYSVAHHLEVPFYFSFNPTGLLYMFLLTLAISTLASAFVSIKVLCFSPIESLKIM